MSNERNVLNPRKKRKVSKTSTTEIVQDNISSLENNNAGYSNNASSSGRKENNTAEEDTQTYNDEILRINEIIHGPLGLGGVIDNFHYSPYQGLNFKRNQQAKGVTDKGLKKFFEEHRVLKESLYEEGDTLSFVYNLGKFTIRLKTSSTNKKTAFEKLENVVVHNKKLSKPRTSSKKRKADISEKEKTSAPRKKQKVLSKSEEQIVEETGFKAYADEFLQILRDASSNEDQSIEKIDGMVKKAKDAGNPQWVNDFLKTFYPYSDKQKFSPLMMVIKIPSLNLVKKLKLLGADVNLTTRASSRHQSITPLHIATKEGTLEIVKFLLESGANVDALDTNKQLPIFWAIDRGNIEIVKILAEDYGANTARIAKPKSGEWISAAKMAENKDKKEIVAYFKQKDASDLKIELSEKQYIAALSNALQEKEKQEHAKQLLDKSNCPIVNLNSSCIKVPGLRSTVSYFSLFELSGLHGDPTVIEKLIENGGDPNPKSASHTNSFLHILVINGHEEAVKYLVEGYFEKKKMVIRQTVNVKGCYGKTPLYEAMISKHEHPKKLNIVKILVESLMRANIPLGKLKNKKDSYENPLALAESEKCKDPELAKYFRENFIVQGGILIPKYSPANTQITGNELENEKQFTDGVLEEEKNQSFNDPECESPNEVDEEEKNDRLEFEPPKLYTDPEGNKRLVPGGKRPIKYLDENNNLRFLPPETFRHVDTQTPASKRNNYTQNYVSHQSKFMSGYSVGSSRFSTYGDSANRSTASNNNMSNNNNQNFPNEKSDSKESVADNLSNAPRIFKKF